MKEEKTVSASGYIITFFNDIESLTNSLGHFSNLLAKLKGKYPTGEALRKLPDMERGQTVQIMEETRFWLNRSYIKYSALKDSIKEFKAGEEKLDKLYNELVKEQVPNFDTLKEYVIELNKLFVLGIVSTLLTQAYDVYAQFSGKNQ